MGWPGMQPPINIHASYTCQLQLGLAPPCPPVCVAVYRTTRSQLGTSMPSSPAAVDTSSLRPGQREHMCSGQRWMRPLNRTD